MTINGSLVGYVGDLMISSVGTGSTPATNQNFLLFGTCFFQCQRKKNLRAKD